MQEIVYRTMPFFIDTTTPKGMCHNPLNEHQIEDLFLKKLQVIKSFKILTEKRKHLCVFINLSIEIIEKVTDIRTEPVRPDQPKLIDNDANPQILSLMQNCWEEDPAARPDISNVLKQLKTINKGR